MVWPCYGEMLTWVKHKQIPVNEDFIDLNFCYYAFFIYQVLKICAYPAGTWIWLSSWQPISKQRTTCYEMVHFETVLSLFKVMVSPCLLFFKYYWFYRPRPFHFAIVDEVDSVLIDEGRNPLLISGEVWSLICSWSWFLQCCLNFLTCEVWHIQQRLPYFY